MLLQTSALCCAAPVTNGPTTAKKAKTERHMGQELLDFINEAWTQYHAVGAFCAGEADSLLCMCTLH